MDSPLQTAAVIKFHPAPVISRVLFSSAASRQRQVPLFKVWCCNQSRVFICCPPALRIPQRQRENPLWIDRHAARLCPGEEVPVYSVDARGLDLLPGDAGGNGTWDGKRWGVWCVPLIRRRCGEICVRKKEFLFLFSILIKFKNSISNFPLQFFSYIKGNNVLHFYLTKIKIGQNQRTTKIKKYAK